jgi:hypothetical protein
MRTELPWRRDLSAILVVWIVAGCSDTTEDAAEQLATEDPPATAISARSIRIVNLWSEHGTAPPVHFYLRPGFGAEAPLLENSSFGTVAMVDVPPDATILAYHAGESGAGDGYGAASFIASEDLEGHLEAGLPLTVVLVPFRALNPDRHGGSIGVFMDDGDRVIGGMPARSVEGSLLVADFSPAGQVTGEEFRGLKLGRPGEGCLGPAGRPSGGAITVS